MSRTSKITLIPEWLRLLTDAVTDETGAEVSANTPADARLAFQQGCYNGAHRLASRATPRLAALEAFARAFAGAEWKGDFSVKDGPYCNECLGNEPEHHDFLLTTGVSPMNMHRGHRPDCLRGRAVAMLKDTA